MEVKECECLLAQLCFTSCTGSVFSVLQFNSGVVWG